MLLNTVIQNNNWSTPRRTNKIQQTINQLEQKEILAAHVSANQIAPYFSRFYHRVTACLVLKRIEHVTGVSCESTGSEREIGVVSFHHRYTAKVSFSFPLQWVYSFSLMWRCGLIVHSDHSRRELWSLPSKVSWSRLEPQIAPDTSLVCVEDEYAWAYEVQ